MKKRLFIAVNIPEKHKKELKELRENFKFDFPESVVKWVEPENLHITLAFLGSVREDNLPVLKEELEEVNFKPFEINLNKLTYIPNRRKAKMIWAKGVSDKLIQLHKKIENVLIDSGAVNYSPDQREYTPHVTLARMRSFEFKKLSTEEIPLIETGIEINFEVDTFELMESKLGSEGPEYFQLKTINSGS